jgi:hypothetical protein
MKRVIICLLLIFLDSLVAYSFEKLTHMSMNREIVTRRINGFSLDEYIKQVLGLSGGIKEKLNGVEIMEYVEEGGRREDEPEGLWLYITNKARNNNHFHNPLEPLLEHAGLNLKLWIPIPQRWPKPPSFFHLEGQSSVVWAQNPNQDPHQELGGNWSWHDARDYFYKGLTLEEKTQREEALGKAFRALGQLMHLVQDLSVPAHTRNEVHGLIFHYEAWLEKVRLLDFKTFQGFLATPIPFDPIILNYHPESLAPLPIAKIMDTNAYTGSNPDVAVGSAIGIAEYTNANFFGENSIFSTEIPYPARTSAEEVSYLIEDPRDRGKKVLRKYYRKVADGDTGYRLATVGFLKDYVMKYFPAYMGLVRGGLDGGVYTDYASRLVPRAVGYSAGLLKYFFRGQLGIEQIGVRPTGEIDIAITNLSDETLKDGSFELYYDNKSGQRKKILLHDSSVKDLKKGDLWKTYFKPPSDFDPEKRNRYMLVFKGQMGESPYEPVEPGAVIGKDCLLQRAFPVMVTFHKEENKIFFQCENEADNFYLDCAGTLSVYRARLFSVVEYKAHMGALLYDESSDARISKLFRFRVTRKDMMTTERYLFEGKEYRKYEFEHAIEQIENQLTFQDHGGEGVIYPPVLNVQMGHPERPGPASYAEIFKPRGSLCVASPGCWGVNWEPSSHVVVPVGGDSSYSGFVEGTGECGYTTWAGVRTVGPIPFVYRFEKNVTSEVVYHKVGWSDEEIEPAEIDFVSLTVWLDDPEGESLGNLKYSLVGSVRVSYRLRYRILSTERTSVVSGGSGCVFEGNDGKFTHSWSSVQDDRVLYYDLSWGVRNEGAGWELFDIFGIKQILIELLVKPPYKGIFVDMGKPPGWENRPGSTNTWYIRYFEEPQSCSDGWGVLDDGGKRLAGHLLTYTTYRGDFSLFGGGVTLKYVWHTPYDKRVLFAWDAPFGNRVTYNKGGGTPSRAMGRTSYGSYSEKGFYFINGTYYGEENEIPAESMAPNIYPFGRAAKELLSAKDFWELGHVPVCDSRAEVTNSPTGLRVHLQGKVLGRDPLTEESVIIDSEPLKWSDFGILNPGSIELTPLTRGKESGHSSSPVGAWSLPTH